MSLIRSSEDKSDSLHVNYIVCAVCACLLSKAFNKNWLMAIAVS